MPSHRAGTLLAALVVGACLPLVFAAPPAADVVSDAKAAAQVATDQGYRTGVAALDLRAAIARDPTVGPWLMNAMAHTTEYGADGTYQFFGIPSATTGAAIKQGWGDDGDDSPNAVFNSTGCVDNDEYAVAILTDGRPWTYGEAISSVVTQQAQALMPGGRIDDPADHNPVLSAVTVTATGNRVQLTGTAVDPDAPSVSLSVRVSEGGHPVATAATTAATRRFDVDFAAPNGTHTYTVTVGNLGDGAAASRATASVSVDGDPHGTVNGVTGGSGTITVDGQESDPNSPDPRLEIGVDGAAPIVRSTDAPAYQITLPASAGIHEVTVTYLHSSDGQNVAEGTWAVTVAPARGTHVLDASAIAALPTLLLGIVMGYRRLRRTRRWLTRS